jgi:hypothetical protein
MFTENLLADPLEEFRDIPQFNPFRNIVNGGRNRGTIRFMSHPGINF